MRAASGWISHSKTYHQMVVKEINYTPNSLPLLSFVVGLENITDDEIQMEIGLDESQRQRVCEALDIVAIEGWEATAYLSRALDGTSVSLRVDLAVNIMQSCVVTLEPVHTCIEHSFRNLYSPEAQSSTGQTEGNVEVVIGDDDDDVPDVLEDQGVDVGAAIVEQLALVIDPYPRTEGASLIFEQEREATDKQEEAHPFAVLNSWRS